MIPNAAQRISKSYWTLFYSESFTFGGENDVFAIKQGVGDLYFIFIRRNHGNQIAQSIRFLIVIAGSDCDCDCGHLGAQIRDCDCGGAIMIAHND